MLELTIGIVGATGVVGQTAIDILTDSFTGFRVKNLKLFASRASVGKIINFNNKKIQIEDVNFESLATCHVLLFATDSKIALEFIPKLAEKGILCIDKSSAFRNHTQVPLVVPEINGELLSKENMLNFPVIASPNCCTIPLVMVLKPLYQKFKLQRAIVSTYQSVSGAGRPAMEVLTEETKNFFSSHDLACSKSEIFPKSIAFNVMPFVAAILEDGSTDEEAKIVAETRKILNNNLFPIAATSVRVPTFVGHGEAVTLEFANKVSIQEIKAALSQISGLCIIDALSSKDEQFEEFGEFVTPREAHGKDHVFVSRIRQVECFENGVSLWIVCDNLRKGAALNAIQMIEECALNGTLASLINK